MPLFLGSENETIKVISSKDSCIRCNDDEYLDYLETLDEELLNLDPDMEPTRFILRKVLSERDRQVLNSLKIKKDKRGKPSVNTDYMIEEIYLALEDIEEDPSLPPEKRLPIARDLKGKVSKDFLKFLDQANVLNDLHSARDLSFKARGDGPLKKS